MSKRLWTVTILTCATIGLALALTRPSAQAADKEKPAAPKKDKAKDLFSLGKVWQLHLELSAKEFAALQPAGRGFPMFGGPGGNPPAPPKPDPKPDQPARETHRSAFGVEFPWTHGDLTAEGKTYKNIGVRYKGNASYMASSGGLKRNFKLDLDRNDAEQRFHGLKALNLNAGAMDPTREREAMSFAVFRAAGVPAPRTAYAEVTLTVPGKYDKELLGLYTVIEQVDKVFLKDRFKNNKGLLMKPERLRGIEYLGDDWDRYKSRYQPKHEPTREQARRVIEFARLVNRADEQQFRKEIGSYLDIDEFLRFMAVNALLVNLDSFFTIGHNYYLYLNPETNKLVFIPWDMDLSMGGFFLIGSPDQQMNLSLNHPHSGENKLIDRLLAIPDVSAQYQKILKELAATCFTREQLLKDIETLEKATKEILAREARAKTARKEGGGFGFGRPGMMGGPTDLKTFVEKRTESVVAQLSGKSKGYVPVMGFGPGGPGGPGGRPGGPIVFGMGNFLARPLLEAVDTNKDGKLSKDEVIAAARRFFKDNDKDNKGSLDAKAVAEGINRIFPRPQGFGPPGGPGNPGGPGRPPGPGAPPQPGGPGAPGFGPGMFLADAIVKRADANKDGKVTLDELVAAAEALFKECDKDKNGTLDEKEVVAGLGILFPPPPGFGQPPPGPRPDQPKREEPKKEKP